MRTIRSCKLFWYRMIGICVWAFCLLAVGCSAGKKENLPAADYMSAPDVVYELVSGTQVPQKVYERIFHRQKERFGFTYEDENDQYIAFGFGRMPTGGYSIQVLAVKDTKDTIVVEAKIIAPEPGEVVRDQESYPYLILRVEGNQKHVQFRLQEEQEDS